jgi:hypothetical protein
MLHAGIQLRERSRTLLGAGPSRTCRRSVKRGSLAEEQCDSNRRRSRS